jgi:hypothetical protein
MAAEEAQRFINPCGRAAEETAPRAFPATCARGVPRRIPSATGLVRFREMTRWKGFLGPFTYARAISHARRSRKSARAVGDAANPLWTYLYRAV